VTSLSEIYAALLSGTQAINNLQQQLMKTFSIPAVTSTLAVFGAAGGSHTVGLVPDPGTSSHNLPYYLGDDAAFHSLGSTTAYGVLYVSSLPSVQEVGPGTAGQMLGWTSSTADPVPVTPFTMTSWQSYTPTAAPGSGSIVISSVTGAFLQVGGLVIFNANLLISSGGAGGGFIQCSLPVSPAGGGIVAFGREVATTGVMLSGTVQTTTSIQILTYNNTYPASANPSQLNVTGLYRSS
jgi:hypothetical protein